MRIILIFYINFLITFVSNSYSQSGWFPLSGGSGSLYKVFFINENIGWIVGSSTRIFKTINGGTTWQMQNANVVSSLYDVQFINENTGWSVGSNRTILKTIDGGTNWVAQMYLGVDNMYSVSFVNDSIGLVGSSWGKIFKTTDGGTNWIEIDSIGVNNNFTHIQFTDANTGYIGDHCGNILRTTDGGSTWTLIDLDTSHSQSISGLQMLNNTTGWCATSSGGGAIYKTTNGYSWHRVIELPILTNFKDLSFINDSTGWALSTTVNTPASSTCYKTTDGGISWAWSSFGVADFIQDICFVSSNVGYAVGNNGIILKTTTGGITDIYTTSFYKNRVNKNINDLQSVSDTIHVNLNEKFDGYKIQNVIITVDSLLHTNDSDVEITLFHEGFTDTVVYHAGGNGYNFIGTVLDDSASMPIGLGTAPFTGQFKPEQPLNIFNGMESGGDWILQVYDAAAGNTGTLNAWSITLQIQNINDININNAEVSNKLVLSQNYPNPFNPSTKISWQSPTGSRQTLKVYDILGREVATLVDGHRPAGEYWVHWDASGFASGIYFYQLIANNFSEIKKMLLVR